MPIDDVLRKSVTADEFGKVYNGSVINVMVPFITPQGTAPLPPDPPPYWSLRRDMVMRGTIYHEAMWAAAISIAITKAASKGFEIKGQIGLRVRKAQEMLLASDGRKVGWVGFLSKHLRDYLCTDNGGHIEIVRARKGYGSKIVGLRHLDSLRVQRTGDPAIPALYRDRVGRVHEMRDHQILMLSDMPDPGETYFGVGLCAASRAYGAIYKLNAIETYVKEKVSGLRPLAIYIVNGVLDKQLKDAITVSRNEEVARGLVSYMGAVIIGIPEDTPPGLVTIPLAELPDRFQRKEEFDIAVLTYADNLGLDPQDLQPLSSSSMGQGTQSQILHDKAMGKGIVSWVQQFTHLVNEWVMPGSTTFAFTERDYRDMMQRSQISQLRVANSAARIGAQITTADQELQILVDEDELPREFLKALDQTTEEVLSDTEKPIMNEPNGLIQPGMPATMGIGDQIPTPAQPGMAQETITPEQEGMPGVPKQTQEIPEEEIQEMPEEETPIDSGEEIPEADDDIMELRNIQAKLQKLPDQDDDDDTNLADIQNKLRGLRESLGGSEPTQKELITPSAEQIARARRLLSLVKASGVEENGETSQISGQRFPFAPSDYQRKD